jgi:trans-aconitate methyltransferase
MVEKLEAEAERAAPLIDEAIRLASNALATAGVTAQQVIDLGCGPGVGTTALARAFPSATVVAVDGSPTMLARARARARREGLADRIESHQLDLDGDLGTLARCDLVWAAMSIHHVDDEVATLDQVRSLVEPNGLLCVLERLEAVAPGQTAPTGAAPTEAYPTMLDAAGFDLLEQQSLAAEPTGRVMFIARPRGAFGTFDRFAPRARGGG